MALITADRVKETTTTTGTGPITLAGAVTGFRSFASVMALGDTCTYAIVSKTNIDWEIGTGSLTASDTLARTSTSSSSNGGAPVYFIGECDVFLTVSGASIDKLLSGSFTTLTSTQDAYFNGVRVGLGSAQDSQSIAIGSYALYQNFTPSNGNTAIGSCALYQLLDGNYNVAIGSNALYDSNGTYNIAIGYSAGGYNTGGSNNVIIGSYGGGVLSGNTSGYIVWATGIGELRSYCDPDGKWYFTSGKIGVGAGTPLTLYANDQAQYTISTSGAFGIGSIDQGTLDYGTAGQVLTSAGSDAAPTWSTPTGGGVTSFQTSLSGLTPSASSTGAVTLAGTLGSTSGGTGQTSYATGDLLYASAANTLSKLSATTNGYVLTLNGGVPTWAASTGGVTSISGGTTGLTPATASTGAVTLAGTLAVANGGTGVTTSTGSGANVLSTSPTLVTPNLGTPSSATLTNATGLPLSTGVTGTLSPTNGGTGQSAVTTGDILYGSAANTWSRLAGVATGNVMLSGGVGAAPAWGKVNLTAAVTGTLPVANGGTGLASYAVGDLLVASGATTLASLPDVATGAVLVSGGVGAAPSYSTAISVTSVSDIAGNVRSIPQNAQSSASYTVALADNGKHVFSAFSGTTAVTIPANASVAFPIGSVIMFVAVSASTAMTIAITTDTMTMIGTGLTGTRTLAPWGMATALKVTATSWVISGVGLS